MQAFEEININRRDIQQALAGQMDALERILTIPQEQLNQATAKFLLDEVTPVFLNSPENHCAITLAGYARSKFKPINATPTELAQSLELALQYYEQATKMGNALAMCCAANCYVKAEGTKQDLIKAAKYFRNALKILSNNQSIKIAFTAMMRRFECPNEALYDYWITEEISDVSEQIKKRLLQNKWYFLNQIYLDQDPTLTKQLKIARADFLFAGEPSWSHRTIGDALSNFFVCAMMALWEIEFCDPNNTQKIEANLCFAINCHERILQIDEQDISALLLHDAIELTQARRLTPLLNINSPEEVLEAINMLQSITTLSEANYWLADIIMKLNTDQIFLNHKDKYRLILSLLSRVSENDREHCVDYNMWLKQAIASLKQIQTAFVANDEDETVYISFNQLLKLLPGYNNPQVLYSPRLECELLQAEKFQQAIQQHFGNRPVVTFEFLIYKSYNDCFEQLDLNYLHNHLINLLLDRVIPKKPAVVAKKSAAEALVIDSGNAGLGRKRGLMFRDIRLATEAHLHDLALKAIELAITDFNIPANRNGFYLAFFNTQFSAANKLLAECKENRSFKEVIMLIVTHLQTRHTHVSKGTFRLALLERLVEVLNLGKIEKLATEPEAFCDELCAILKDQCQQRTIAPPATEQRKDDDVNNNNNIK